MEDKLMIESIPNYSILFHPIYTNNFSFVSINKNLDLTSTSKSVANAMAQLNHANYSLYKFLVNEFDIISWNDLDVKNEVRSLLNQWKELIENGLSFASFPTVDAIFSGFGTQSASIVETLHLKENLAILEEFKKLNFSYRAFFKLSFYTDFNNIKDDLQSMYEYFLDNSNIFENIERLEVASNFRNSDTKKRDHPSFSIIFKRTEIQHRSHAVLKESIDRLKKILRCEREIASIEYVDQISNGMLLSQGYRFYKKYLSLIDEIDSVYDPKSNYSYIL